MIIFNIIDNCLGMIFTAGIGSSILYWAPIEWAYYYQAPPYGAEAFSAAAGELAAGYGYFHWGLSAWAIFCLPALPIAYHFFVKKQSFLRLSITCEEALGAEPTKGVVGKIIDVAVIFGILGGIGTTIGLGTPMVSALIAKLIGTEPSFGLNIVVMLVWIALFTISVSLGLQRGIKRLSDTNVYLALIFLAFVLLMGSTAFMINTMLSGMGFMLDNFMKMSLWTDSIAKGGFPQGWTIFYWAWWISWAPFVSIFVARISKGRTIRETILGVTVIGSLGCWLYYSILGNHGLFLETSGILKISDILNKDGGPATIVAILGTLPLPTLSMIVYTILAFICLATSLDSAAYTLASIASDRIAEYNNHLQVKT